MAKSLRSKKKKRLRTLRREIAQPFYDNKEVAKLAAQEAALAAPKLEFRSSNATTTAAAATNMDVEMDDGGTAGPEGSESFLKPVGSIGKKWKKNSKLKKDKRHKKKNKRKHKF